MKERRRNEWGQEGELLSTRPPYPLPAGRMWEVSLLSPESVPICFKPFERINLRPKKSGKLVWYKAARGLVHFRKKQTLQASILLLTTGGKSP